MEGDEPIPLQQVSQRATLALPGRMTIAVQESGKMSKDKIELLATLQELEASDETWAEIRRMIADFFAARATAQANKVAEEQGWTDEDFHRMARTHLRTPYRS